LAKLMAPIFYSIAPILTLLPDAEAKGNIGDTIRESKRV